LSGDLFLWDVIYHCYLITIPRLRAVRFGGAGCAALAWRNMHELASAGVIGGMPALYAPLACCLAAHSASRWLFV
jgi:hypothetical protein